MPIIQGTNDDDFLKGTVENDEIYGLAGDDYLYGGADGNDSLNGGSGNDELRASDQNYIIGVGNTTLDGGSGNDNLYGGNGNDSLIGGTGNDTLSGYDGNDTLMGGDGNDQLYGYSGDDSLSGNAGNDSLGGNDGNDSLYGDSGNDSLYGEQGNDFLNGGSGDDLLVGIQEYFSPGSDQIDVLMGGAGKDTFASIYYYDDRDSTTAGTNSYALIKDFNRQQDVIQLVGAKTNYYLAPSPTGLPTGTAIFLNKPGSEPDELIAIVEGVSGLNLNSSYFTTILYGGDGNDSLIGSTANDSLFGYGGNDTLMGSDGNDDLFGGSGDDSLSGDAGNDSLRGDDGNDFLNGGSGDDLLVGIQEYFSSGSDQIDVLMGGAGKDTFASIYYYDDRDSTTAGTNSYALIKDFNRQQDVIQLVGAKTNYYLAPSPTGLPTGTAIFLNKPGSEPDELIAIVQGVSGLNLNNSYFTTTVNDVFSGTDGADKFDAGEGDDELRGFAGDDTLLGGSGKDTLEGSEGNDFLNGGDGNDILVGSNYTVVGSGMGEIDTLAGGRGEDTFVLGSEYSPVLYDDGDTLTAGTSHYALIKDFNANEDFIRLKGATSNYYLAASPAGLPTGTAIYLDKLGSEPDELIAIVEGVSGLNLNNSYFTTTVNDVFNGSNGADRFDGGQGHDRVSGEAGDDVLLGGNGNDRVSGEAGDDVLLGGNGNDSLEGGSGNDSLTGGNGDDILRGTFGASASRGWPGVGEIDTLTGGAGRDKFLLGEVFRFFSRDEEDPVVYYNNRNQNTAGTSDYALIVDFNSSQDVIQLAGRAAQYSLGSSPSGLPAGTAIFYTGSLENELIAIVQGVSPSSLSLSSSYFNYVIPEHWDTFS